MAVKEKEVKEEKTKSKTFSFEDLNKTMSKISILGSTMDKSEISRIDEYLDSGNYHLNAALTGSLFKGYPCNRTVSLSGESGSGKTFLMLNAVRQAQLAGYYIYYYDSENAVDSTLIEKFGVDPKKFFYIPCNTVQEFRTSITNLTKTLIEQKRNGIEIPKVMVCLDSAGNLATQKEIDDAVSGSEKSDMTRAKVLKSIFRIIMTPMAECKIPFIFSNHVYSTQSMYATSVAGGGTGPEYAASIIMFLSKAQLKDGEHKTGIIVTAKPNKNRFAKPNNIKFHLHFSKGMNRYVGLENYISWENCGIERGKLLNAKEFDKLKEKEQEKCTKNTYIENGEEHVNYFFPQETGRGYAVKHLNEVVKPTELFSGKVFTQEVLEMIDEKFIKPKFRYSESADDSFDDLDLDLDDETENE
jgi:RecA/RadA recombinase